MISCFYPFSLVSCSFFLCRLFYYTFCVYCTLCIPFGNIYIHFVSIVYIKYTYVICFYIRSDDYIHREESVNENKNNNNSLKSEKRVIIRWWWSYHKYTMRLHNLKSNNNNNGKIIIMFTNFISKGKLRVFIYTYFSFCATSEFFFFSCNIFIHSFIHIFISFIHFQFSLSI